MERNSSTGCSETTRSKQNDREQQAEAESSDQSEENDDESKPRNGGSSSNSTVEENDKKPSTVRPYVRSKTPRLRWTHDLHLRFIHAVERLGGQERATPKLILQRMNIKGPSIAHVKSHLQMFRSKKIDDTGQVINDHRHLVESGKIDDNFFMLQGYHRHQGDGSNTFRYGDASWNARHISMRNPYTSRSFINEQILGLNGTVTEIFGSNWTNYNFRVDTSCPFNALPSWKLGHERLKINEISSSQAKVEDETNASRNSGQEQRKVMKRTISDGDLDLDLSLWLTQANGERRGSSEEEEDVGRGRELTLSLYSPSSSSKVRRLKREDDSMESGRRESTLDLTI